MNDKNLSLDTLHELSAELLDGSITPAAFAKLSEAMTADRQAQQFFVRYVDLHATLLRTLAGGRLPATGAIAADTTLITEHGATDLAGGTPPLGLLSKLLRIVPGGEFVVGGLVLLAVCGAVWGVIHYLDARQHDHLATGTTQHSPISNPAVAVGSLATDAQARWTKTPTRAAEKRTRLGQRYELAEGRAELRMNDGTRIVIQGPASWQVASVQRLELSRGKLVAQVPKAAVGFVVATPTAEVTDLGTEFSLVVDGPKQTQLAVSQGMVELVLLDAAPRLNRMPVRVVAGEAMSVSRSADGNVVAQPVPLDRPWTDAILQLHRPLDAKPRIAAFQASPAGAPGNVGLTDGNIGFDFRVMRPIRVFSLGIFDHLGDGIDRESDMTVQLWSRNDHGTADTADDSGIAILAELVISSRSEDRLEKCHRFLDLPEPLELEPGEYTLLSWGFSPQNRCVEAGALDGPDVAKAELNTSHYAIVPLGCRAERGVKPGGFPKHYPKGVSQLVGGSFEFEERE